MKVLDPDQDQDLITILSKYDKNFL